MDLFRRQNVKKCKVFLSTPFFFICHPLAYLRLLRRSGEPLRKFLIFAQGRSGGTLLVDLLNSNPQPITKGADTMGYPPLFTPIRLLRTGRYRLPSLRRAARYCAPGPGAGWSQTSGKTAGNG